MMFIWLNENEAQYIRGSPPDQPMDLSGNIRRYFILIHLSLLKNAVTFILQSHTILLVQPGKKPEGRTYSDYESVNECLEGEWLMRNRFIVFN